MTVCVRVAGCVTVCVGVDVAVVVTVDKCIAVGQTYAVLETEMTPSVPVPTDGVRNLHLLSPIFLQYDMN